jgi:hypothetical protein
VADTPRDPLVAHDDLDLFLTTWYRWWLATLGAPHDDIVDGVVVDIAEPALGVFPEKLLLLRTMDRNSTGLLTADALVHIEVLAGTKQDPKPAADLMRIVLAGLNQIPDTDLVFTEGLRNPVASFDPESQNGPYPIPEKQDRARLFANATFGVTAVAL